MLKPIIWGQGLFGFDMLTMAESVRFVSVMLFGLVAVGCATLGMKFSKGLWLGPDVVVVLVESVCTVGCAVGMSIV